MNYRKIWEAANGPIPTDSKGRKYEIHHIDGNHKNNELSNLVCLPVEEHYKVHLEQGDYSAANLIADRINNPILKVKGFTRPHTEETKAKLRGPKKNKENYKGPKSEQHRESIRKARIGTTRSEETIKKMSNSLKGRIPWNKGLKIKQITI